MSRPARPLLLLWPHENSGARANLGCHWWLAHQWAGAIAYWWASHQWHPRTA